MPKCRVATFSPSKKQKNSTPPAWKALTSVVKQIIAKISKKALNQNYQLGFKKTYTSSIPYYIY